ncbi:MAG TPA: DUF4252 domain-containing protein [Candidatus Didemnitutus sp.]|nr:DUF4252 domain-containing protein [Candidatus Didemnitutus sp.]
MKNLLRISLATAALSLVLSVAARAAEDPGYVDIGQLLPSTKGQFVEVNLSQGMLKFAAKLAAREEPECADLIANLKRIRVNVVGLDDNNRAGTLEQIESVRRKLESQGWTQIVKVRETEKGDNVDIHVRQTSDEVIEGLVITVIDHKGEAVFVNIVGNIHVDQLSKIADKFDIEPLKHVHINGRGRADEA